MNRESKTSSMPSTRGGQAPDFNIQSSSSSPEFSGNMVDLVIKARYASVKYVTMHITWNGNKLCESVVCHYNKERLITINIKEMINGIGTKYTSPESDVEVVPFDTMMIILTDAEGNSQTVRYDVIMGGTRESNTFAVWATENWLTWQPQIFNMPLCQPQWLSMVKLSEESEVCTIYSRLYTRQGVELEKVITQLHALSLSRVNVSFDKIWSDECQRRNITPIAYDVWGDDSTAVSRPFTQRYIIRSSTINDRCFMFENSLGGFDTIIATGAETIKADGDVRTFISADAEHELTNSHTTTIEQDTGYIEDERQARQWKEFLASNNRAVYRDGEFIQIVVCEYDLKHKQRELTSYSFEYRLSAKDETASYERYELPKFIPPHKYYNHGH